MPDIVTAMREESKEYDPYESIIRKIATRPRMRRMKVPVLSHACAEEMIPQLELFEASILALVTCIRIDVVSRWRTGKMKGRLFPAHERNAYPPARRGEPSFFRTLSYGSVRQRTCSYGIHILRVLLEYAIEE